MRESDRHRLPTVSGDLKTGDLKKMHRESDRLISLGVAETEVERVREGLFNGPPVNRAEKRSRFEAVLPGFDMYRSASL